jgi:hypothetical protein
VAGSSHARGGNTHDATNTRFSVMAKKHELHHFPAFPRSIVHQKPANSLQHRAWGQVGYVCTLSLLLFVSTARCQAAPSQNLGCSISFALAQDRSLVHPSPRHPIRPAVLRGRRASEDVQHSCVFFGHRHHPASSHCTLIDLIGSIHLSLTRSRIASTESETAFLSPLRIPNNLQTSL